MGTQTGISWTDHTWNPWQGCRKVSQGCRHCYMYAEKSRYGQEPATVIRSKDATFYAPLKWERQAAAAGEQRKVFTCSWSDFFIEEADPWRDEAFALMALTPHLTYQVLTKRPERMLEYFTQKRFLCSVAEDIAALAANIGDIVWDGRGSNPGNYRTCMGGVPSKEKLARRRPFPGWPLPNVWLGVSVEDQATADARIPILLQTPATVRFVSYEPALGEVCFRQLRGFSNGITPQTHDALSGYSSDTPWDYIAHSLPDPQSRGKLDWVICGGESGPKARPCATRWIRSVVQQCARAKTACFVKQLGSTPTCDEADIWPDSTIWTPVLTHPDDEKPYSMGVSLRDRKGADPAEWPEDLRIQQFPLTPESVHTRG